MSATVWVVDDEESVRDVVGAMLKELGYEVRLFEGAEPVLKEYKSGAADVIITDVRMPGMSGMELTRVLLDKDPDAIIMILTGFPSIPDAVEAIRTGAADFLSKPCRMEEIRIRIERALESREVYGRLRRTRTVAWVLIASLPIWFILGILLARLLQS
ncbi:MAG: response regulator [Verrucomicrobiae bacterium]|nr:response regulator [Verrucomicrobiae bacterium]